MDGSWGQELDGAGIGTGTRTGTRTRTRTRNLEEKWQCDKRKRTEEAEARPGGIGVEYRNKKRLCCSFWDRRKEEWREEGKKEEGMGKQRIRGAVTWFVEQCEEERGG